MSAKVGFMMIISGIGIFIALSLKLLVQPFISEDHYINEYFPSTELVLGIPILLGVTFFCVFGAYILWETKNENKASS
ncbi:hypothetical protein JTE90_012510 [Oedothorax gibbosus]|uniref:Dolichol phosphate-mannose biosynthesis regulatory protein n=1 Tax=Oedothorax gibbosus TaxID=931172 RepID=A0AAV6V0E5_9ARAC|nr:hypothetical protein JTE90_012510 [Oedothorax gibbosus]